MKGYRITFSDDVTDEAVKQIYGNLWSPIIDEYQAKLKTVDLYSVLVERRDTKRSIVVEFPSYEATEACYEYLTYVEAREHALRAAKRDLLILKGGRRTRVACVSAPRSLQLPTSL